MLHNLVLCYGEAITHNIVNNIVAKAQKDIEYHNFMVRKNLLEYDTVVSIQRTLIYTLRKKILINYNILTSLNEILKNNNKLDIHIIKQKQHNYKKIQVFEAKILLCLIDTHWKTHINNIENIKKSVNLQVYVNKNPLDYYKKEVYEAFNNMLINMEKSYLIKLQEMYKTLDNITNYQ
jgi:preprotein translocase subunit SecA